MKKPTYVTRFLCIALALAWSQGAQASTVFWGSNFNDHLFDSTGNALDSTYSFEIGAFTGGFTPTYQNVDQWQANWHVIDRAYDPDANGWNSIDQFFVGTVEFNTSGGSNSPDANPGDVFTQGDTVYLWAYNSKSIVPSSQWALVTDGSPLGDLADNWIIPDPLDTVSSFNWQLTDANTPSLAESMECRDRGPIPRRQGYSACKQPWCLNLAPHSCCSRPQPHTSRAARDA
jgi:hypothetical protein